MKNRPLIVISACLAGEPVRYDGTDRCDKGLLQALRFAEVHPLCPEVGIGLGVPRPPIRLMAEGGVVRVRGVEDPALDVTDRLTGWGEAQLPLLASCDGVVLKSRSPSCGVAGVPRLLDDGSEDELGMGHFASFVQAQFPQLPLADDRQLQDPRLLAAFTTAVKVHFSRSERQGDE
ncbi:MAG: DUF523 domain-containing protein [Gammaproteobacteria bacterium]|nr:MAG: DUF523 domain-containing protein [Gammaproteobacteria bacterium]